MSRRLIVTALTALALIPAAVAVGDVGVFPGADGIGDPYFPKDGNGGYDVSSYDLAIRYDPAKNALTGTATLAAKASHGLTQFNLDLDGLTASTATVNGGNATIKQSGGELTIKPALPVLSDAEFEVVVRYAGTPGRIPDTLGGGGVTATPSGAVFVGQPHIASTWFPVNDHPLDTAAVTTRIEVPRGLSAISNGELQGSTTSGAWTRWTWRAAEPMAPYLVTAAVGKFDLRAYTADGVRYWDAIDSALTPALRPRTGKQFAVTGSGISAYQRLTRTLAVPAKGAKVSFSVRRSTEPDWDYFFVEARTAGGRNWTTLKDRRGHTSRELANFCPGALQLHPFLKHYQKVTATGCAPKGSSGTWWAASGISDGYERWTVDLGKFAGRTAEVSLTYVSDDILDLGGVVVDDIKVSTGTGSTSFEKDRSRRDGWTFGKPPKGSPQRKAPRWTSGSAKVAFEPIGAFAERSLARQPEMIRFLAGLFGPYPFSAAGGIVTAAPIGFALENQTRPVYGPGFFGSSESADSVLVHEITHQWFGDDLTVAGWREIWLNEGFATYAEWLWADHQRLQGVDAQFAEAFAAIPADDPFWQLSIGDPGPDNLFAPPVYQRGAMTLHQLRKVVGEEDFFHLLRRWPLEQAGRHVRIPQFIALAERVSGQDLTEFFQVWLFTPSKPTLPGAGGP